ncbi:nucleoside deaminase [candidate division WOR-3 bacterium]|nr:nucleoside deaminase [candidate division WOR-3 bacterium]
MDRLEYFMDIALEEALKAYEEDEVPVGAVIVKDNKVISKGHNSVEKSKDAIMHAEIIAIRKAQKIVGDWRLSECYLFSTIEPCIMCTSAAILSRIDTIIYGAEDPKFGGIKSLINIPELKDLNHKINVIKSVRENEAIELMQNFFRNIRLKRRGG